MSTQPSHQPCAALEKLDHGHQYKLVLFLGPANSGKEQIIQQWVHRFEPIQPKPICISIESGDNQQDIFFAKLVQNLKDWDLNFRNHILHEFGDEQTSKEINQPETGSVPELHPSIEDSLNVLINRFMQLPGDRFLIMLNYHLIDNPIIHAMVAYLLDFQPPNLHLVITSQVSPPLQIPRLRARRELLEIGPDE